MTVGVEAIEASRAVHANSLREIRPAAANILEPLGGLALVHSVVLVAAPENAEPHSIAYKILVSRLEKLEPDIDTGLGKMWKEMPLRQKIPLYMRRIPSELDAIKSAYIWDRSLESVSQPLGSSEIDI